MPSIAPPQNTPVLPNIRRRLIWPSGASCSRRNSAKLSLATIPPPLFVCLMEKTLAVFPEVNARLPLRSESQGGRDEAHVVSLDAVHGASGRFQQEASLGVC